MSKTVIPYVDETTMIYVHLLKARLTDQMRSFDYVPRSPVEIIDQD